LAKDKIVPLTIAILFSVMMRHNVEQFTNLSYQPRGNTQGLWTLFNISLPSSADNNANVKLGFEWKNNSDGQGVILLCPDSMIIYTFTAMFPLQIFL
jgi:hypothetical protein